MSAALYPMTPQSSTSSDGLFRLCIVAPTYNNAETIGGVLVPLAARGHSIIVVNDGSTDADSEKLLRLISICGSSGGLRVTDHPRNLGKAAALHTGFWMARLLGFTHALTIDTDGQHDPDDANALIELARENPTALVLGARPLDTPGYPSKSKWGRYISNGFVSVESGVRVTDSQCGLRVYPLRYIDTLGATSGRYSFETEILTRAGWARLPVIETPIRGIYELPTGRVTHFRPLLDSLLATGLHLRLFTRSLFFVPPKQLTDEPAVHTGTIVQRMLRWLNPVPLWRQLRCDPSERERFAGSLSVGIFIATLPPLGFKTVLCLGLAKRFRLQPLVVIAGSNMHTPPIGPMIAIVSIMTGHLIVHQRLANLAQYDPRSVGLVQLFKSVAIEWSVGSVIVGTVLAMLTYALFRWIGRALPVVVPATQPDHRRPLQDEDAHDRCADAHADQHA